jgi:hypothetical protein
MKNKVEKVPVPKKAETKKLCFKNEPWYQSAQKAMSIANRKPEEVRFSMNYLPPR